MTRLVSLWLPRWSTDRLYRQTEPAGATPPEAPLVLKGSEGRRHIVAALNLVAERTGIRKGMPLAKAQLLTEGLAGARCEALKPPAVR